MAKRSWWLAASALCVINALPSPTVIAAPIKQKEIAVRLRTIDASELLVSGADLKISGHGLPTQALWLKPVHDAWIISSRDAKPIRVASNDIHMAAQALTVDNEAVPENTSLSTHGSKVDVIAHLDLETYLLGVLPAEMPASWPIEALKAQAIAARTFAVKKLSERGDRSFQLDSTVSDQMYKYKEPSPAIIQAVNETRGQILVDSDEQPIDAFFHADCGGQTEQASSVWETSSKHDQRTARDGGCRFNSRSRWSYQIETRVLYDQLSSVLELPGHGEFVSLNVSELTDSGRAKTLTLTYKDEQGQTANRLISGQLSRETLGFERVKSTLFSISIQNGKIVFNGRGSGHGVGLCQQGAKGWAQRGLNATQILTHYYQTAHIGFIAR